jgi:hypothetical protein
MTARYPERGVRAVLGGQTYLSGTVSAQGTVKLIWPHEQRPANPRFTFEDQWARWTLTLPITECDQLYEVSALAQYRGAPCQVMTITEGRALLYYAGHNGAEAERLGFEQTDPGTYSNVVPVGELHDYREERVDLLFDHWRRVNFPALAGSPHE